MVHFTSFKSYDMVHFTRFNSYDIVITSYSIHYTKLYESACRKRRMSPEAAAAPAFIWRARPRGARSPRTEERPAGGSPMAARVDPAGSPSATTASTTAPADIAARPAAASAASMPSASPRAGTTMLKLGRGGFTAKAGVAYSAGIHTAYTEEIAMRKAQREIKDNAALTTLLRRGKIV